MATAAGHAEDFLAAHRIFVSLRLPGAVAVSEHNLGFVASRAGDLNTAFEHFERARRRHVQAKLPLGPLIVDHSEALLAAGLAEEAYARLCGLLSELEDASAEVDLADALLLAATAALRADRPSEAEQRAVAARTKFEAQGRLGWPDIAALLALEARLRRAGAETGVLSDEDLCEADQLAERLRSSGQHLPALQARLLAVELTSRLRGPEEALRRTRALSRDLAGAPAALRLREQALRARMLLETGAVGRATRVVVVAQQLLEHHQVALAATDLRVGVAEHAAGVTEVGRLLAWKSGDARRLFDWIERTRASSMRCPRSTHRKTVVPPFCSTAYVPSPPPPWLTTRPRRTRLAASSSSCRTPSRSSSGEALRPEPPFAERRLPRCRQRPAMPPSSCWAKLTALSSACGSRRSPRAVELVATKEAVARKTSLMSALRVLAQPATSERAREASASFAIRLGSWFDEHVLGPVLTGDGPAVIIPPPSLADFAWGLLPSLRNRPFAVSPSATTWLNATRSGHAARGKVALIAGPRLPLADAELDALRPLWPGATTLGSEQSTSRRVLPRAQPEQRRSRRRPLHPPTRQPPVLRTRAA